MLSISGRYSAEMKSTIHILLSCHHSISIDDNACRFVLLGYIIIPGLIENISWIQHLAVGIRALECIYIKLNVKLSVITEGTGAELGRSLVNCAGYSKLLFSIMWRGKGLFPKINWRVKYYVLIVFAPQNTHELTTFFHFPHQRNHPVRI